MYHLKKISFSPGKNFSLNNFSLSTTASKLNSSKINSIFKPRIRLYKDSNYINHFHRTNLQRKLIKSLDISKLSNDYDNFKPNINSRNTNFLEETRTNKLSFEIGNLLQTYKNSSIRNYCITSNSLGRIKFIMKTENENLEKTKKKVDKKKIEIKDKVYFAKNKYHNLIRNQIPQLDDYLIFLRRKINDEIEETYNLEKKKTEIYIEIHKINAKINNLKNKKIQYINYRNFLICVKEKILHLPEDFINSSFYYDNNINKYNINSISNEMNNPKTPKRKKNNRKRRSSIMFNLMPLEKQPSIYSATNSPKRNKSKFDHYLNQFNPIFNDVDEFYLILYDLEQKNIILVNEFNHKQNEVFHLKKKLNEEMKHCNEIYFEHLKAINSLEEILLELKKEYEEKIKEINYLKKKKIKKKKEKKEIESLIDSKIMKLKFEKYKRDLNFKRENSYMFYYIYLLFKNIYFSLPEFFPNINNEYAKNIIKILQNPEDYKLEKILESTKHIIYNIENMIDRLIKKINILDKIKDNHKTIEKTMSFLHNLKRVNNLKEQRYLINEKKLNKIKNYIHHKEIKVIQYKRNYRTSSSFDVYHTKQHLLTKTSDHDSLNKLIILFQNEE